MLPVALLVEEEQEYFDENQCRACRRHYVALRRDRFGADHNPSWVVLYPGDNIQNHVNLFPAGTTFYLKAGTYGRQQVTPKSGDTFIGQPGAIMDGQNVTANAFYSNNKGQSNVTIKSLEIKNYTTPNADYGAITGQNVTKWIVTDNVVHHNKQAGIRAGTGTGWQVLRNKAYANGVAGITAYQCNGGLIPGNEVYGNNPSGAFTMREGGMKVFKSVNLTIRGNNVHHNKGKGIWSDTNYPTMLIEGNTVTDNSGTGIYHEIGYAAIIRNNTSSRNGNGSEQVSGSITRAGIQVTNSPNVQVYGNTVMDNHNGISGLYFTGTRRLARTGHTASGTSLCTTTSCACRSVGQASLGTPVTAASTTRRTTTSSTINTTSGRTRHISCGAQGTCWNSSGGPLATTRRARSSDDSRSSEQVIAAVDSRLG